MYMDREKALAYKIEPIPFEVERWQLRFFAETIGQTNPVYFDLEAARRAGHRDLPVPLTFLSNSVELSRPNPMSWLHDAGGDFYRCTHAEQHFKYHAMAYAGDSLMLQRKIVDVYVKKGGALEFVVKQTDVKRGDELIAEVLFVGGIRHPEALK